MVTLFLLSLPFLTGAAGQGCGGEDSSVVKQDRIHTSYWVYYDANTDITYARATFRLGHVLGTVLELTDPAKVTFNDKPAAFSKAWGWHEVQLPGRVPGTFTYTNVDGQRFVTVVDTLPVASLPMAVTLKPGAAATFAWQGPAIVKGERLEVIVTGENKLDFSVVEQRNVGAVDVVLPADKTQRFNAQGWLGVRRTQESTPSQAPDAGGLIWATSQPKDARVTWAP